MARRGNRAITLPVSVAVVVAVPVLIGQAAKPEAPAPPDPKEAALEIQLTGEEATSKPELVRVTAAGVPPASAILRSADGTETGQVTSIAAPSCAEEEARDLGLADNQAGDWCLQLSDFAEHAELSGTLTGTVALGSELAPTALALTVRHRDSFWWSDPFWVLIVSFLVSIGLALALPALGDVIRKGRLGALLWANRIAGPTERIAGLEEWAKAQKGKSKDLAATLAPIVKEGPAKARSARARLTKALSSHPLGQHPLEEAARNEAGRSDHKLEDFLDSEGQPRSHHPADELAAALETMHAYKLSLDRAEVEIEHLKEQCRREPTIRLRVARARWADVGEPAAVASLADDFEAMRNSIDERLADPDCLAGGIETTWVGKGAEAVPAVTPATAAELDLGDAGVWSALLAVAALGTIMAIVIAVGFAFITVEQATYDANATFGSRSDYFGLISAALAAGVAGTIAGLLAPWRSETDAAEG